IECELFNVELPKFSGRHEIDARRTGEESERLRKKLFEFVGADDRTTYRSSYGRMLYGSKQAGLQNFRWREFDRKANVGMSGRDLRIVHARLDRINVGRTFQVLHKKSALLFRKPQVVHARRLRRRAVRVKAAVEIESFDLHVRPVNLIFF